MNIRNQNQNSGEEDRKAPGTTIQVPVKPADRTHAELQVRPAAPIQAAAQVDENALKEILRNSLASALMTLTNALSSGDATQSEKIRAAEKIITLAMGKDAQTLQISGGQADVGRLISNLFQEVRYGNTVTTTTTTQPATTGTVTSPDAA